MTISPASLLFAAAVFLSAFLLFALEPMAARLLLPHFGGVPAVWTTCVAFFQAALLLGYLYAHRIARLPRSWPRALHLGLLLLACLVLALHGSLLGSPLVPMPWRPGSLAVPALEIVLLLTLGIGLPFVLLSATAPLLQAWYAQASGASPYRLYALSNAGSLAALVAYPLLVEPALSLHVQSLSWSAAFGGLVLLTACTILSRRGPAPADAASEPDGWGDLPPHAAATPPARSRAPRLRPAQVLAWVMLPAAACVLLLAVTARVCQEIAVVPFLWIVPLALYLLSFVVCFCRDREHRRILWLGVAAAATLVVLVSLFAGRLWPIPFQVAAWGAFLFAACMVCHGELARLRPEPARLTAYYLAIAAGGAAGGLLVSLAAPLLFAGYWELHLGIAALWLVPVVLAFRRQASWGDVGVVRAWRGLAVAAFVAVAVTLAVDVRDSRGAPVESRRSFFGVVSVLEENTDLPESHRLMLRHGSILHGFQYTSPARRLIPYSYFGDSTGVAWAFQYHPRRSHPEQGGLNVGVTGLGAGTLAAWGQPGDHIRFFEINPDVVDFAASPAGYFTYLADSAAQVDVVVGDGRRSLAAEAASGDVPRYDLLVLDAFTSDSVPVHLLTQEAFDLYASRLAPGGILAVNISNNYVDLSAVVWTQARRLGLSTIMAASYGDEQGNCNAVWFLLTANERFLTHPIVQLLGNVLEQGEEQFRPWTDDYSSLWSVMTW